MPKRHKFCLAGDCVSCHEWSFASVNNSRCWSRNNLVRPRDVKKWTRRKFEFECDVCFHLFSARLDHVTEGRFCPYCAGSTRDLCKNGECAHCFSRSFASVEKSTCWTEANHPTMPRDISKWSEEKYEFKCDVCYHLFLTRPSDVTRGGFCPFCRGLTRCKEASCTKCFSRSLASSPKSPCWNLNLNNGQTPGMWRCVTTANTGSLAMDASTISRYHPIKSELGDGVHTAVLRRGDYAFERTASSASTDQLPVWQPHLVTIQQRIHFPLGKYSRITTRRCGGSVPIVNGTTKLRLTR